MSVGEPGRDGALGSRVAAMSTPLPSEIADPLARLDAVGEDSVRIKALTQTVGARLMTDYSQFTRSAPAGLAARLYTRTGPANPLRPLFNCMVTNIPGPQQPLCSGGARLVTQYDPGPVVDGMALSHPVFSYCGEITTSFTSGRPIMSDPEFYANCLESSYHALREAAGGAEPQPEQPGQQGARE